MFGSKITHNVLERHMCGACRVEDNCVLIYSIIVNYYSNIKKMV